jgi:hypothetical protein
MTTQDPYVEYYNNQEVLFEMVKLMRGKEVCFLSEDLTFRNIKAHNIIFLKSNFHAFDFYKWRYNIYISCADYNNAPAFSYNPVERKKAYADFTLNINNYLAGYDYFIDLEKGEASYREAGLIKQFFDYCQVPYKVRCSGSGFHFIIPSIYFTDYFTKKGIARDKRKETFKEMSSQLKKILHLTLIDMSVYDLRRVYKVPYSLDHKTGNVILPLTSKEFDNFTPDYIKPATVLARGIRDRGDIIINEEKGDKNIEEMIRGLFNE